jgi:type II secretory pathway pseudopilin PulG
MNSIRSNKKQSGFTLIELGVVFAILAGLGYWVMNDIIAPGQGKQRVSSAGTDVSTIVGGSIDFASGKDTGFTGLTMTKLTADAYINPDFGTGSGENPWGGNYTAAPLGSDPYTLVITVTSVPTAACNRMAAKSPQAICASNVVTFTIAST